jgi:hypothetical protein
LPIVIKIAGHSIKIDVCNRIEVSEINSIIYGQIIFQQSHQEHTRVENSFLNKQHWENHIPTCKRIKTRFLFHIINKNMKWKWIKDKYKSQNSKGKAIPPWSGQWFIWIWSEKWR